jgi:glycosyltransferase involved in cell wall biosynthesis
MARICLVSPHHPANNPRLVREANALSAAGHDVVAVMPRFDRRWASLESTVTADGHWQLKTVDFLDGPTSSLRWIIARGVRRICELISRVLPLRWIAWRSTVYGYSALEKVATATRADLYIAHAHPALPIAMSAAKANGARVAFDAEDLLADAPNEPHHVHGKSEALFLKRCVYVSTMSEVASEFLVEKHSLPQPLLVLHNVFPLSARAGLLSPNEREAKTIPSIYWFGQTIGRASCADQVIKAMPQVAVKFKLCLRGNAQGSYVDELQVLAESLGCLEQLVILPVANPNELVALAAEHDVLLGTQPRTEPYTQLAIGNKIMAGMMAGLALLMTDTPAHQSVLAMAMGTGGVFPDKGIDRLVEILNTWFGDPVMLLGMQRRSWESASDRFNWDFESRFLIDRVQQSLRSDN